MKQNRGVTYFITLSIFHWPLHANPDRCLSMTQPANIPVAFDNSDANTDRYAMYDAALLTFRQLLTIAMLTLIAMYDAAC